MSNIAPENTRSLLDEPIPSSFKASTIVPTPFKAPAQKGLVMRKLKQFNDWIISMVPEPIKRTVSDKLKALKETISKIYSTKTPKEIECT